MVVRLAIRAKALGRLAAGPLTMRELAGQLGTDPPYTTVVIDDLERRGLVRRSTSPDDRRVKIGTITGAGSEQSAAAPRTRTAPPPALAEPREHRMLKTIERVTKRHISIEKVPTVADLRARRLDMTRDALRGTILGDDLDGFRVVVESLADEFDLMEVGLAAVKLAHHEGGGGA